MWNLFFGKRIDGFSASLLLATAIAVLAGCGGGAPANSTPPGPIVPPTPTATYLDLSATPTTVKVDGSTTTTITVTALDAGHAAVGGVPVTLSADTGILGAGTVITDSKTGIGTVTFSAGGSGSNSGTATRTATITATAGSATSKLPVQMVGSTIPGVVSLALSASSATVKADGTNSTTITVVALDSARAAIPGVTVTLSANAGILGAATLVTNSTTGIGTVTFTADSSAGSGNRTAVITASAGVVQTISVDIVGSEPAVSIASLDILVSPASVTADGLDAATITITALNTANAAVPGALVSLRADTGILSAASVTTGSTGKGTVNFSAGSSGGSTPRTATITATNGCDSAGRCAITKQVQVQIVAVPASIGIASIDITAKPASVKSDGSDSTTITVTALDAGNAGVRGVRISLSANTGILNAGSILTDANGSGTVTFSAGTGGLSSRTATITATGGGVSKQVPVQIVGPTPTAVASIDLSASPTTVKSDGSTTTTITVTTVNAARAAISGVTVTMSADTGLLDKSTFVTDAAGKGTVIFSGGSGSINRTATITATADTVSALLPVQIVGSTVTLSPTVITLTDDGLTTVGLTVTALDPSGNVVPNAAISLTKSGTGNVRITPASGTTDFSGKFTATITGVAGGAGSGTLTASALGATATSAVTVTSAGANFSIDQLKLSGLPITVAPLIAMQLPQTLEVRVNAPSSANVLFATSIGVWNGTAKTLVVPVVAGKATATLTTTLAGLATISVSDFANPASGATLTVAMTAATAFSISLQATPSVVPKSVGSTTGFSTVIAIVKDSNGFPVGGVPVAFSIVNPTGGGETISPVVVMSAATTAGGLNLGEARASFTSGALSTSAQGVQVRASVVNSSGGTSVATGIPPSGPDVSIVIGGTAGSVAFGTATVVSVGADLATYILPMSVLVTDSNGNPAPLGTVVNLSSWPKAWSTGNNCGRTATVGGVAFAGLTGTFLNEDSNENVILDAGEDGTRSQYDLLTGAVTADAAGTIDGLITPPNSASGSLPATVTTDANGVAAFSLTYTKASAIWMISRLRARTIVQGSDMVGEIIFRLPALADDVSPTCRLPDSPYRR